MDTYHITFTGRTGARETRTIPAPSRQGAITTARTMYGARGDVSAVRVAAATPPVVSIADAFFNPAYRGRTVRLR